MKTPALLPFLLLPACISVKAGPDEEFFRVKGLANVHASVNGLSGWDGNLLDIGLFTNTRGRGEIFSIEVGPFAGAGVGIAGARARVLPLEVGAGTLFYDPRPRRRREPDVEPDVEPEPKEPLDETEPGKTGEGGKRDDGGR